MQNAGFLITRLILFRTPLSLMRQVNHIFLSANCDTGSYQDVIARLGDVFISVISMKDSENYISVLTLSTNLEG